MIKNSAFELRTIGHLLKDRREERGLSLEEVAKITKIRFKYLEAIENSSYTDFPSEVYLKGFLKNYAKFLGISTSRALAMYRREREYQQKEPTIKVSSRIKETSMKLDLTPSKLIMAVLVGAVIFTILYVAANIGKILQEPTLAISEPIEISAGSEGVYKTTESSVQITGELEIGATLTVNGQVFETSNFERFIKEFTLEDGLNTFILNAESQFGKKSELTLNVIKEDSTESEAEDDTAIATPTPSSTKMEIAFQVIDRDAYVEAVVDGTEEVGRVLSLGTELGFTANSTFTFSTPRPDAIIMTINGESQIIDTTTTITWEIVDGKVVRK